MAQYRDLNEPLDRWLARRFKGAADRAPQTQPTGIKHLGDAGDVVWDAPELDPDTGQPLESWTTWSVKDMPVITETLRIELDTAEADLNVVQDELDQAKLDIIAAEQATAEALQQSADAWNQADAAFGEASQATQDAQAAFNKAVEAEQTAEIAARVAVVKIDSSRGVLFKSNDVSTVLTVTVFKGDQTITDILDLQAAYGAGSYLEWQWQRFDEQTFGVISSADPRIGAGGFTLTLSPADVDTKTVFRCTVNGAT